MGDVRELVAPVTIRCCATGINLEPFFLCGAPARFQRPGAPACAAYFCDVHRQPTDTAIADVAIVRRISIVAEVCFNGILPDRLDAEHEALMRLIEAVGVVGGAVSLHTVSSDIGRQGVPSPAGVTRGRRGRGRVAT